jgi:hypothetical protein
MWFTGINYYKLAVEKDRDSIFTTITTIWKPGLIKRHPFFIDWRSKHTRHRLTKTARMPTLHHDRLTKHLNHNCKILGHEGILTGITFRKPGQLSRRHGLSKTRLMSISYQSCLTSGALIPTSQNYNCTCTILKYHVWNMSERIVSYAETIASPYTRPYKGLVKQLCPWKQQRLLSWSYSQVRLDIWKHLESCMLYRTYMKC